MYRPLVILALTTAYATLRYNVFKHVPWEQWPLYVTNKAFGLSALLLLVWLLYARRRTHQFDLQLTNWTVAFMLAHVFISLAILHRHYYPKYFTAPTGGGGGAGRGFAQGFTLEAGFSWLLGAIATAAIFMLLRRCIAARPHATYLGIWSAVVGLHAALLGYAGWFTPSTWPGYMVPITLISALAGAAALALALLPTRSPKGPDASPAA